MNEGLPEDKMYNLQSTTTLFHNAWHKMTLYDRNMT